MSNQQKQFTEKTAPEGYWTDAKDAFIPVKLLKPIDLARDSLVGEIVTKAIELNKLMKEFKNNSFADIAAFVDLSANEYDVKLGGKKGNVTLFTFDGRYKIQRAMADRLAFDERLQAAKELID
ncbi:sulfate transporter, partial [Klebsiella variicola]